MGTPDDSKSTAAPKVEAETGGAKPTAATKPETTKPETTKPETTKPGATAGAAKATKAATPKAAEKPKAEPKPEAAAKPKPDPKPKTEPSVSRVLMVSSAQDGFRRAGRAWSKQVTAVPEGDLTPEEVRSIMEEPMLTAYWAPIRDGAARMVRAKFVVRKNEDGKVELEPVTGGSAENDAFFNYTPWGKLEMGVVNPAALPFFSVGREIYLDFMPAD